MAEEPKLSYTSALILTTVAGGRAYGFDIMQATGLPSGTIYPALRRLEEAGLVRARWEDEEEAREQQRPARRNYSITRAGTNLLQKVSERYRLPANIGSGSR